MQVKVEQIPEGGLKLSEPLPVELIEQVLPRTQELAPAGVGLASLSLQRQGQTIVVSGSAKAEITGLCASCLKSITVRLEPKFSLVLFRQGSDEAKAALHGADDDPDSEGVDLSADSGAEDDGVGEYDGKVVEWGELVREQLVLAMPLAPRCKDDCAGLCPECGADRNETACGCVTKRMDPRWEKLRLLKLDKN